ncbi:hypothetical protein PR048_026453 [Dryococelus australis]|uniref:Uncharacterized protein n=1 Tax=Dryococelus australis TaxID=614101 RepID=A0ABQ9GLD6_9NEOP|nr:hypothetical protein PR048_026453 [Dryococelus australis]
MVTIQDRIKHMKKNFYQSIAIHKNPARERLKAGDCLAGPVPVVSITLERHASQRGLSGTLTTGGYSLDQNGQ